MRAAAGRRKQRSDGFAVCLLMQARPTATERRRTAAARVGGPANRVGDGQDYGEEEPALHAPLSMPIRAHTARPLVRSPGVRLTRKPTRKCPRHLDSTRATDRSTRRPAAPIAERPARPGARRSSDAPSPAPAPRSARAQAGIRNKSDAAQPFDQRCHDLDDPQVQIGQPAPAHTRAQPTPGPNPPSTPSPPAPDPTPAGRLLLAANLRAVSR